MAMAILRSNFHGTLDDACWACVPAWRGSSSGRTSSPSSPPADSPVPAKEEVDYESKDQEAERRRLALAAAARVHNIDDDAEEWAAERRAALTTELSELDQMAPEARKVRIRALQRELHPDKHGPGARARVEPLFQMVQDAWTALSSTAQVEPPLAVAALAPSVPQSPHILSALKTFAPAAAG